MEFQLNKKYGHNKFTATFERHENSLSETKEVGYDHWKPVGEMYHPRGELNKARQETEDGVLDAEEDDDPDAG